MVAERVSLSPRAATDDLELVFPAADRSRRNRGELTCGLEKSVTLLHEHAARLSRSRERELRQRCQIERTFSVRRSAVLLFGCRVSDSSSSAPCPVTPRPGWLAGWLAAAHMHSHYPFGLSRARARVRVPFDSRIAVLPTLAFFYPHSRCLLQYHRGFACCCCCCHTHFSSRAQQQRGAGFNEPRPRDSILYSTHCCIGSYGVLPAYNAHPSGLFTLTGSIYPNNENSLPDRRFSGGSDICLSCQSSCPWRRSARQAHRCRCFPVSVGVFR